MQHLTRRAFLAASGALATVALPLSRAWALVPPVLTGTVLSPTSIRLNWTDAGDERTYRVFRNGNQITSTSGLTHTDSGLTSGLTYSYFVRAIKGNQSVQSNTVQLTPGGAQGGQVTPPRIVRNATVLAPVISIAGTGAFPPYNVGYAA